MVPVCLYVAGVLGEGGGGGLEQGRGPSESHVLQVRKKRKKRHLAPIQQEKASSNTKKTLGDGINALDPPVQRGAHNDQKPKLSASVGVHTSFRRVLLCRLPSSDSSALCSQTDPY